MSLLGLRIDVDTYAGGRSGLPRLLGILSSRGIRCTICIPGGTDRTGTALLRILEQPGYLRKLLRTRAWMLYGPSALTTLAPFSNRRVVDLSGPISRCVSDGHELMAHGFVHTAWHNRYHKMAVSQVRTDMIAAVESVRQLGTAPCGFGAPGWQSGFAALKVLEELQLDFGSDTRGVEPFVPTVAGYRFTTPQVPTTLPTLDELPDGLPSSDSDLKELLGEALSQSWPVFTAHAELEGRFFNRVFESFLDSVQASGRQVVPLSQLLATRLAQGPLPVCEVVQRSIAGRPGTVATQGSPRATSYEP